MYQGAPGGNLMWVFHWGTKLQLSYRPSFGSESGEKGVNIIATHNAIKQIFAKRSWQLICDISADDQVMYCFHRSRLRADLGILYDRGVEFYLILDGQFVLGCPLLNLTNRGQYQTGLTFKVSMEILF